jgi:hypothetical protein
VGLDTLSLPFSNAFFDGTFVLENSADPTKTLIFNLANQATSTQITLNMGAQTASRIVSLPVLTGNDTYAMLGLAQTLSQVNTFSNATASTSTANGAVIVAGGIGVTKNSFFGGTLGIAGIATLTSATASTSTSTGTLVISGAGGVGIGGAVWIGGVINVAGVGSFTSGTASSSTTTGAIIATGGIGVSGAVNIGGTLTGTSFTFTSASTCAVNGLSSNASLQINAPTGHTAQLELYVNGTGLLFYNSAGTLVLQDGNNGTAPFVYNPGALSVGNFAFSNTTVSTSSTTGALTLAGGLGVAGAACVGGILNIAGVGTFSSGTASTSTSTGAVVISGTGGMGIGGALHLGGILTGSSYFTFVCAAGNNCIISGSSSNASLMLNASTGSNGTLIFATNYVYDFQIYNFGASLVMDDIVNGTNPLVYNAGTLSAGYWAFSNTTVSSAYNNGAAIFAGGVGIAGAVFTNSTLTIGGALTINSATLIKTNTTFTAGATGNAPTLTAGPVTGNPTKWVPINDNGTTRYIPCW